MERQERMTAEKSPLVSVVVAFYNIEDCVDYCVQSLIRQTYKNCEFVLVDDGSTDGTGGALDAYADNARVRILHTPNHGPSGARNFGVEQAEGSYISFVDGDDFVHSHYVEELMTPIVLGEATSTISFGQMVVMDEKTPFNDSLFEHPTGGRKILAPVELLNTLCYETMAASACARMAPREVYLETPFPMGAFYEDLYTVGKYIQSFGTTAVIDARLYGYVRRSGSIANRKVAKIKQAEDFVTSIREFDRVAKVINGGERSAAAAYFEAIHFCRLHTLCNAVMDDPKEARAIDDWAQNKLKSYAPVVLHDKQASRVQRIRFWLLMKAPSLYDKVFLSYKQRVDRV